MPHRRVLGSKEKRQWARLQIRDLGGGSTPHSSWGQQQQAGWSLVPRLRRGWGVPSGLHSQTEVQGKILQRSLILLSLPGRLVQTVVLCEVTEVQDLCSHANPMRPPTPPASHGCQGLGPTSGWGVFPGDHFRPLTPSHSSSSSSFVQPGRGDKQLLHAARGRGPALARVQLPRAGPSGAGPA